MKKILMKVLPVFLVLMFFSIPVSAAEEFHRSVTDIVTEIKQDQGITEFNKIDIGKVSDPVLEELGDSVMESIIGNAVMHERMDDRLGGEGSPALAEFHRELARQYLSGKRLNMMSLMRDYRLGDKIPGERMNRMMGYGWMGLGWLIPAIFGFVVFVALVLLVVYLVRRVFSDHRGSAASPNEKQAQANTALAILDERYAKGEIDDAQYARMKAEIKK
jgi:putative membrane protein